MRNSIHSHLPVTLQDTAKGLLEFSVPYQTRRSQGGISIIDPDHINTDPLNLPQDKLKKLVQGIVWREQHFDGSSLTAIANSNNISRTHVMNCIDYSFQF